MIAMYNSMSRPAPLPTVRWYKCSDTKILNRRSRAGAAVSSGTAGRNALAAMGIPLVPTVAIATIGSLTRRVTGARRCAFPVHARTRARHYRA